MFLRFLLLSATRVRNFVSLITLSHDMENGITQPPPPKKKKLPWPHLKTEVGTENLNVADVRTTTGDNNKNPVLCVRGRSS